MEVLPMQQSRDKSDCGVKHKPKRMCEVGDRLACFTAELKNIFV